MYMLSRIFIDFLCPPDNHLMHTHVTVNIYFKEIVKKKYLIEKYELISLFIWPSFKIPIS